uniref:Uncharacterized protein n=1 Tax=viral metagenome TaxID=1070528 RepID=A0A6C0E5Z4_9ZZZZ
MGTPLTRLNGKTEITKLIVNQDISKISTKSTRKINVLIHKLEDTISELNEATIAETHMHDDEIEYNQMFIELLKHEINRIFETICKLFNNPMKNKHTILCIFEILKTRDLQYGPMKVKLYDTECSEEKSSHIQHFDRFVDGYYKFMNEFVIPRKRDYIASIINILQTETILVDDNICDILSFLNKHDMITKHSIDTMVYQF